MTSLILKRLDGRVLNLRVQSRGSVRAQRGAEFRIPVAIVNSSEQPVHWSPDHPLHLSYRWLDTNGEILDREGIRTKIPGPLLPKKPASVELEVVPPDQMGKYVLLISLLLEGIHWGCDVSAEAAIPINVSVVPPPAWPIELKQSTGGKALRGAIAAKQLHAQPFGHPEPEAGVAIEPAASSNATEPSTAGAIAFDSRTLVQDRPRKLRVRFRNWLRRSLGITDLKGRVDHLAGEMGSEVSGLKGRVEHAVALAEKHGNFIEELILANRTVAGGLQETGSTLSKQGDAIAGLQEDIRLLVQLIPTLAKNQHSFHDEINKVDRVMGKRFAKLDRLSSDALQELRGLNRQSSDALQELRGLSRQSSDALREVHDLGRQLNDVADRSTKRVLAEVGGLKEPISDARRGLADKLTTLAELGEALRHELKNGAVTVEMISTLRRLAALVEENQVPGAIQEYSRDFAEWKQVAATNWARQFSKLDSLLLRQNIPLASSGIVLLRNRFGLLAVQDDDPLAVGYYSTGDPPERATVALAENLLQPGDVFVDVGANVGIYSLIAGRKVGPKGKIVAFEPTPSTFDALRVTIAVNALTRLVELHECALGSKSGSADLFTARTSGHNSLLQFDETFVRSHSVEVRRGDDVLGEIRPALVKIDVEGWEIDVLEGLSVLIATSRETNLVVEFAPDHIRRRGMTLGNWWERIAATRRTIWRLDDDQVSLISVPGVQDLPDTGCNLFLADEVPASLGFMLR